MVGKFKVDISFHQIEGLSTLCFFEEVIYLEILILKYIFLFLLQRCLTESLFFQVDDFIRQNHLFKRSIILIKAWCYYESCILGSHCRLLSSYALDILVLYIFHVYNNQFAGPLEVTNLFVLVVYCYCIWMILSYTSHFSHTSSLNLKRELCAGHLSCARTQLFY